MVAGRKHIQTEISQSISDGILALDSSWEIQYINERGIELLHLNTSPRSITGRVIWDVKMDLLQSQFSEKLREVLEHGGSGEVLFPSRKGDDHNDPIWLRSRIYSQGSDDLTAIFWEANEEVQRRRQRHQYREMIRTVDQALFTLGNGGIFTDANDAMAELTGYSKTELLDKRITEVFDAEWFDDTSNFRKAIEDGEKSVPIEGNIVTASGQRRVCEVYIGLLSETVGGMVGMVNDITPERQWQQQLAVLDRVLRHNLRTDVNLILGRAELIRNKTTDEDILDDVEEIIEKVNDLVSTSEHVREFSDALAPDMGNKTKQNPISHIDNIIQDKRSEYPEADLRLHISTDSNMYIHSSVIPAIQELIENAIIHNDTPVPEVLVSVDDIENGERIKISVADNGPGLPETERAVVNQGSESPLSHASGLGLWLVSWAINKSGGELCIEDNEPRGTVVSVSLPAIQG